MFGSYFYNIVILVAILSSLLPVMVSADTDSFRLESYNVVWDSPSEDCSGSMPIGNGDIGLNVWVEKNGDLVFYIGKTDSWGDNNALLKVGKVRISLTPNPLNDGSAYQQVLNLGCGMIEIQYGKKDNSIKLNIWVDANNPVVYITSQSQNPVEMTAKIELWRTEPHELLSVESSDTSEDHKKADKEKVVPDTILENQQNRIGWYHHNKKSLGYEYSMRLQGLSDFKMIDPILHRTFGAIVTAENAKHIDDSTLSTSPATRHQMNVYVMTKHPSTSNEWLTAMDSIIKTTEKIPFQERLKAHKKWWSDFWNRSWIYAKENRTSVTTNDSNAFIITRAYTLQRFINACAGRGAYPIKFNGSVFTVPNPPISGDADYRRWGPAYWWQNTRLPYISMCTSGDFDLMHPLFKMYAGDVFELAKYRNRRYFGYDGVYFSECIYFWGAVVPKAYGKTPFEERQDKLQEGPWHKWEWVAGPELVYMMLDYYEHTQDEIFLQEKILPVAREVMTFFEKYYKTGADGKLVMNPSQALETWRKCTNPMPEVAGLHAISSRLLSLPERLLSNRERLYWETARKKLPDIPTREDKGMRMLAPAEKFDEKRNKENAELYAVFPFRQIAIGRPDIELGIEALKHRWDKGSFGWRQDDIFMAYLGLTDQTRNYLAERARNKHVNSRFPAFWGPNYDWIPDQDHGGVLMKAYQAMLMQTDGKKIYLLPAWPKDWDVYFKLHAPYETTIEGNVRNGKIKELKVIPKERFSDVEICNK